MKKDDKQTKDLEKWQGKLSSAKAAYSDTLEKMRKREAMYYGSHEIQGAKKNATNVRNIIYELIESQVDSATRCRRSQPSMRKTGTWRERPKTCCEIRRGGCGLLN